MSHVRQQIRTALAATLTGLTTTGARVYVNRAKALATGDLPALVLRVRDERIEAQGLGYPGPLLRQVDIEVEILAAGASAANAVDTSLAEVEVAVAADSDLGGLLSYPMQLQEVAAQFDDEVSPPIATLSLRFAATYSTLASAPETAI